MAAVGLAIGEDLDGDRRRQERDRRMVFQDRRERVGRRGGVEQAEVEDVAIERVEPLAGLGDQLERRPGAGWSRRSGRPIARLWRR